MPFQAWLCSVQGRKYGFGEKYDGMLYLVNILIFQWYFPVTDSFGGILRFLRSFSAVEPIFQIQLSLQVTRQQKTLYMMMSICA